MAGAEQKGRSEEAGRPPPRQAAPAVCCLQDTRTAPNLCCPFGGNRFRLRSTVEKGRGNNSESVLYCSARANRLFFAKFSGHGCAQIKRAVVR